MRAPRHWFLWSSDHKWETRAKAYDAYLDQVEQEAKEQRVRELARRRAEFEFPFQDAMEERFHGIHAQLKKTVDLPLTDVVRKEEAGPFVDSKGTLQPKKTTVTKIKGVNMSAEARLNKEMRETGVQACSGPHKKNKQEQRPANLPPFIVQTIAPDPDTRAQQSPESNLRRQ